MDNRATEIISTQKRLEAEDANFRNLWQECADLIFPRENQIARKDEPGSEKYRDIYNATAVQDAKDMASGLSGSMIPSGQEFFAITLSSKNRGLENNDEVSRWLYEAAAIAHEKIFASNFMLQLNESLMSDIVFGTGCLFSDWSVQTGGLNYTDYDIGTYQICENSKGTVDTIYLKNYMTARQAVQEFGSNCGPLVWEAAQKPETSEKKFLYIHCVRPRKNRNRWLLDKLNMPFESLFVSVEDKLIVDEGGFEEFPFAVSRWTKSSCEKWGRGQGTAAIPAVRQIQQMERDLTECGNKHNNPPLEVLESFEGRVRVTPGAINRVAQLNSIRAISEGSLGNYQTSREDILRKEEEIHRIFFRDIFVQMGQLQGDRRTAEEIRARINEGLRRLGMPVMRLQSEKFTPTLTRSILLLIRNGDIPYPPKELEGAGFGIEYRGEIALALRDNQARGFINFAQLVGNLEGLLPGSIDNINADRAIPRMAKSFGVNINDIATEEERDEKRRIRAEKQQQIEQMQAAQVAAEGYNKTKDDAGENSPAGMLMQGAGA